MLHPNHPSHDFTGIALQSKDSSSSTARTDMGGRKQQHVSSTCTALTSFLACHKEISAKKHKF